MKRKKLINKIIKRGCIKNIFVKIQGSKLKNEITQILNENNVSKGNSNQLKRYS